MSDVPEGYRMSEVGVIPEEWEVKKFEDIADKNVKWSITGGPFGSNLKASEYTLDGVRIVQLQNIGDGVFNDEYKIFTSEEKANELLNCNIYQNEIILSKMGDPVARACFIPNKGKRFLMASDGIRLVVDESRFSKKFIHDYINSIYFRKRATDASIGSTRLRIGLQDLKKLLVIAPPLPEQQAIASALSDVDALITALEQLITKKRNIKQGAMQQLLTGKKRLPGFGGEWEVKKLGEIADVISGGTPSTIISEFWNGDIKWCTPTDITRTKQKYLVHTEKTISEKGLKNSSATLLPVGALLLCSRATIGEIRIAKDVVCTNQGFKSLVCKKSFDNQFVYYLLLQSKQKLIDKAIGSTFLEISKKDTDAIELTFPSFPEQQAIAQILSDMDTEIEALKQKQDKYKAIKQGMMQELLTGKTRLV